jgi:hypothetical protein
MEFIASTILIVFLLIATISIFICTLRNGISPMPTSARVREKFLENIPLETSGLVYELGSAWGTLAFPIARAFPLCHIQAFENSYFPYLFSLLRKKMFPMNNLDFSYKDFFSISLSDANLIICYLYPGAMEKLQVKMETELKQGCVVLSHTFAIPTWKPQRVYEVDDLYGTKIYLYRFEHAEKEEPKAPDIIELK